MRVLVVHPRMSIWGGGERVAIHSMLAALKDGNEVTFLSEEFDTSRFEDFFGCNGLFRKVSKLSFPKFNPISGIGLLYQSLRYYQKQFRKIPLAKDRFHLVMGTQDMGYTPTTDSPVVQYCYFPEYFGHLESRPSSPLWKLYYKPAQIYLRSRVRLVDQLLSVSNYTRDFVRRVWSRDSTTLYPPCPIAQYESLRVEKENLAVTVGRIVPEKRMHIFEEIARKLPPWKFAIIGSVSDHNSAYYDFLRKHAPPNLSFVLSPLRKVREMLGTAKVYVHCARGEHFGMTIVEAMAAGCVPIVHNSGGPREIVTENVGYRWKGIGEAVDHISRLREDEELRRELSSAARVRARSFSAEVFESSLARIIRGYQNRE